MTNDVLSKEELLSMRPPAFEVVEVPELKRSVNVRVLNAVEHQTFNAELLMARMNEDEAAKVAFAASFQSRFVARCLINTDGSPMFSESELQAVGELRHDVVTALYNAVRKVNPAENEVEQQQKNSEETPVAASSSASPSPSAAPSENLSEALISAS